MCLLLGKELQEVSRLEVQVDVLWRDDVGEGYGSDHVLDGAVVREGVKVGVDGVLVDGLSSVEDERRGEVHEVGDCALKCKSAQL